MSDYVLVTGGAGYIGSHTVLQLLQEDRNVIVIDNLCNSSKTSVERVEKLSGAKVLFFKGDVRHIEFLRNLFANFSIQSVLHFAGLKSVGESVKQSLMYYENNLEGTLQLCRVMAEYGVYKLVFSSSATVYGDAENMPISEGSPTGKTTNPYGTSKYLVERILRDLPRSDGNWRIATLRYFNPVGAHPSGLIGEDPNDIPNNLLPYISQVAIGRLEKLKIFGNDYETKDGTGVRDYIHVVDLAEGHLAALEFLDNNDGFSVFNLGTGKGYSVLEMVSAFEKASGRSIPYEIVGRRAGDIAECFADVSKAKEMLGWTAKLGISDMMEDTWRWQSQNPNGYA